MKHSAEKLLARGICVLDPGSTYIAPDVNLTQIAPGVVIHPGSRLSGSLLSIGACCEIGGEAPATLKDCQLGEGVILAGGFFADSTFLNGFRSGSCAHVRAGCLFEEETFVGHSVGVKQTVFMPWAAAGSLVNLCDCLLSGGTEPLHHSEIGSSYIHFNFTPQQDKATASLLGSVPEGVMLRQPPIFLGGQGGLVGPARIAFGTVIPAGVIWRGDVLTPSRLVAPGRSAAALDIPSKTVFYHNLARIVKNSLIYIGNIVALYIWYTHVRSRFMSQDPFQQCCYMGARQQLRTIWKERIFRLEELAGKVSTFAKLENSTAVESGLIFVEQWPDFKIRLQHKIEAITTTQPESQVQTIIDKLPTDAYLPSVRALTEDKGRVLTKWLQDIVDQVSAALPGL